MQAGLHDKRRPAAQRTTKRHPWQRHRVIDGTVTAMAPAAAMIREGLAPLIWNSQINNKTIKLRIFT